ncbi:MAG TPA: hypothetical protein VF940_29360 [Streptosporangiaceae bacterium]
MSAYDIYRNGRYLGTVAPAKRSHTDATATPEAGYTYRVVARDLAGHTSGVSVQARRA